MSEPVYGQEKLTDKIDGTKTSTEAISWKNWYDQGIQYCKIKDYKSAIPCFEKAHEFNTTNGLAVYNLANATRFYGLQLLKNEKSEDDIEGKTHISKSIALYTQSIELLKINTYTQEQFRNKDISYALIGRGLARSILGDKENAIHDLKESLQYYEDPKIREVMAKL